jgi:hypothetical protein
MRFLFAALLASVASAQTTWIVDDNPGPGVHFTSLPAAVAAAATGDTLLVAPGHYQPFDVNGKALTILGDGNVTTFIDSGPLVGSVDYVTITAPPVGTTFRLSGLTIRRNLLTGSFTAPPIRLRISGNGVSTTGTVVLTDVISDLLPTSSGFENGLGVTGIAVYASRCSFQGAWFHNTLYGPAAVGSSGAKVTTGLFVADACLILGGSPSAVSGTQWIAGGDGLGVDSATVHLTGCYVSGGSATGSSFNAQTGGAGLRVSNSTVQVYGSAANSITGGNVSSSAPSSAAGPGIVVVGATVSVFGAVAVSGGVGPSGTAPAITGTGQVQLGLPRRPALSLTGSAPIGGDLQATQPVTLVVDAPSMASQLFVTFVDLEPGFFAVPSLTAEPFLLTGSAILWHAGLLDAAGRFAVTFVPATQLPGLVNLPLHLQAFALDPALGLWLGSNAAVRRIR